MEEWRPVADFVGYYEVSSLGRVRSLPRVVELGKTRKGVFRKLKGKILKQHKAKDGAWYVNLNNNGLTRRTVHSLVACAFLGPTPEGMEICHGEAGRDCHAVFNLSFKTHLQNMTSDRKRDGTLCQGETHPRAKLTEEAVIDIRRRGLREKEELSKLYDVSIATIHDIVKKRSWRHL